MRKINRRVFLHRSLHSGIAAGIFGNMTGVLQSVQAASTLNKLEHVGFNFTPNDYKALVCIDLKSGNDGFNMIVPTEAGTGNASYTDYQAARGGVFHQTNNPSGLALPESDVLELRASEFETRLGIHHSMKEIQQLFSEQKVAIISNIGPLVRPTDEDDYAGKLHLPAQLFSHSDQQILWFATHADSIERRGWAGAIADNFKNINNNKKLSMNISAGGENVLQVGNTQAPFFIDTTGAINASFSPDIQGVCKRDYGQCEAYREQMKEVPKHPLRQAYATAFNKAIQSNGLVSDALNTFPITHDDFQPFWEAFNLSASKENFNKLPLFTRELFVTARMIKAQSALNMNRQTFYTKLGGFDMHDGLIEGQKKLLRIVSKSVFAFQSVLKMSNLQDQVTTFTASEFGRTTSSNGDGSDHGWGSHHLVIGGAVKGGLLYGKLPNLSPHPSNRDNAGWGQIIPTLSVDQYAATLCSWFGLNATELHRLFPNLKYMTGNKIAISNSNLGFMH